MAKDAPSLVMYILLRRDLIGSEPGLNWPMGAVVAQAAHAVSALLWEHKDDSNVQDYMANVNSMRKVVLAVPDEAELRNASESLRNKGLDHRMWTEQPENILTALVVKPYTKSQVHPVLKKYSLFS